MGAEVQFLICLIFLCIRDSTAFEKEQTVEVDLGQSKVLGLSKRDWFDLGEYYAFRGIRYATPPVGPLRFRDPLALKTFPAFIDARFDGHDCPSIYATNASEDCLNLNVYSKTLKPSTLLPVLVFIHPGGLYLGSSLSSFIAADYLLTREMVLVTFNYRIGTLGYLSLNSPQIAGNAGFKDQVLALQWVQHYIANFGGNPKDITLMGYSAGGLSVSQHLVSPMSRTLFHKAIIMSGIMPPQAKQPQFQQRHLVVKQAQALKCNLSETPTNEDLLDGCLQNRDGIEIAATLRQLFDFGKDNPVYLWLPLIENDFGQERFLTKNYYESLIAGDFNKVPVLIGYTDGEFCTTARDILQNEKLHQEFYNDFDRLAPKIFMYENHQNARRITQAIRSFYLSDTKNFTRLCDLCSDALIRFGAAHSARLISAHTSVYSYTFAYRGAFSNLKYDDNWGKARAEHMDDLMYLFGMQPHIYRKADKERYEDDVGDGAGAGDEDKGVAMVQLYVNFIYDFMRNGALITPDGTKRKYPQSYALITDTIQFLNGTNFADYQFWENCVLK